MEIYLQEKLYRDVDGVRTFLGHVEQKFNLDPYVLMPNVDTFLDKATDAVAATMLQATAVGDLGAIEIKVGMGSFAPVSIRLKVENPATNLGLTAADLATGLTTVNARKLRVAIVYKAKTVVKRKLFRKIRKHFIPKVLLMLKR